MTRDTFLYYLNNGYLNKYDWYVEMFTEPVSQSYEYISVDGNNIELLNVNEKIVLTKDRPTPLLLSDTIALNKGDMNITADGLYSVGDILLNYLMAFYPLGTLIDFKLNLSHKDVESFIAYELGLSVNVDQYNSFIEATDFLQQLSEIFVVSSTDKSIGPAPGLSAYKKKLFKEYREKYGDKFDTDIRYVVELEAKLVEYEREYFKDDPTYGVLMSDKIMSNARKTLYGTLGAEIGMDGEITPIVENSLSDGYPADNKQLASLFNASRKGSIMRGHNTQYSGANANITASALNSVTVEPGDCKTKKALSVLITKESKNEYVNYYIMENGNPLLLTPTNIDKYIDKTVKLRTYPHCNYPGGKYCSTCAGRQGEDNKKIAIILSTENSSIFTTSTMKAMHDRTLKLVDYDLKTAIY